MLYISYNAHEYGPTNTTLTFLHHAHKGRQMTSLENFSIQLLHKKHVIIDKKKYNKITTPSFMSSTTYNSSTHARNSCSLMFLLHA